jgi:hypothetical protein
VTFPKSGMFPGETVRIEDAVVNTQTDLAP